VDPVVVPLLLAELLLQVVPPLRRRRKRRRKRVCGFGGRGPLNILLIHFTEKEESDEDMGFGLFD
jgi:hypothetical protein